MISNFAEHRLYATRVTDGNARLARSLSMVDSEDPRILAADRMNDGVVISFSNGKCAFYSCAVLMAVLSQCKALDETHTEW